MINGVNHDRAVLGADVGGSTTRVAVATAAGEVVAVVRGPAGNPAAVGLPAAIDAVRSACTEALRLAHERAGTPLEPVRAVIGLAGATTLRGTPSADVFASGVLPGVSVRLVSDFAVALSSATDRPRGIVTIAGTGSGAMEIADGEDAVRRDGWGWLLGDEGSGFWLGREAVRATLRAGDAGDPPTGLSAAVHEALGTSSVTELIAACYGRPPRDLAELAPVVSRHADDPTAAVILEQAAVLVADRVLGLRQGREDLPVVLAGSLLTPGGPLADPVRTALLAAGVTDLRHAGDGLAGALWLAGRPDQDDTTTPRARWSQLLGSLDRCRATARPHQ
ncbi:N-acetylglucosamine kinase [Microlunatus sp. Y2014]|uniref:N-acetylglucosamine kinase n=1 Tax=Microlunatus sp. Y2014 TaxID=3418488 RepID=UPI003DA742CC